LSGAGKQGRLEPSSSKYKTLVFPFISERTGAGHTHMQQKGGFFMLRRKRDRIFDILLAQLPIPIILALLCLFLWSTDPELGLHGSFVASFFTLFGIFCIPFLALDLFLMPFVLVYM